LERKGPANRRNANNFIGNGPTPTPLFRRRYSHNSSALIEPPGKISSIRRIGRKNLEPDNDSRSTAAQSLNIDMEFAAVITCISWIYDFKTNEPARIRPAPVEISSSRSSSTLRQHRKLQNYYRNASGGDGQKPLRNPRNQICAVHVCILVDSSNRQQNAPLADAQQTHYLTPD
jgi:hypothetical protein